MITLPVVDDVGYPDAARAQMAAGSTVAGSRRGKVARRRGTRRRPAPTRRRPDAPAQKQKKKQLDKI